MLSFLPRTKVAILKGLGNLNLELRANVQKAHLSTTNVVLALYSDTSFFNERPMITAHHVGEQH